MLCKHSTYRRGNSSANNFLSQLQGGCRKSTSAVLLATELAQRGAAVTIIDADPNQPVLRWSRKPGKPENLTVIGDVTEETLIDTIDDAARKTAFVIVDLEGTASVMVAHAMTRSDLVIIPTKGSELDGIEAAKVIQFIDRQERAYHRKIPFAVLFTQTNPAVRPRTLKSLEADMLKQGFPSWHGAARARRLPRHFLLRRHALRPQARSRAQHPRGCQERARVHGRGRFHADPRAESPRGRPRWRNVRPRPSILFDSKST